METSQNIESVLHQAFNFGSFGTNAKYQSFKCEDQMPSTDIELNQDLTGTVIFTNDQGIEISKDLVIKTINEECSYSFKHLAFLSEISIRRRILPYMEKYSSVKSHFNHFYYGTVSSTTDNDDAVIILERLQNVQQSPQFWDHRHLFVAMEFLGKFHGISYSAKSKDPIVFLPQLRRIHEINFSSFGSSNITLKLANSYSFNGRLEYYIKDNLAKKPEPLSVICLGITNTAKTSVQYDLAGDPVSIKFEDLFGARYAPPAFDLMNILYLCVDQKTRVKYWNEALQLYYNTLIDNIDQKNDIPLFVEIQKDFKFYSLLAYVTALASLAKSLNDKTFNAIMNDIENDILSRNVED